MEHIHRVLCQQLPVAAHRIFLDTADQHHPLLRLIHDEIEELRGTGEVRAKRLRTRIEVDEDKAAILIEQRYSLELVKRVSLEVRRIGFRSVQTDQLACVVELPCMVDAREASCIAGLFTDDLRAAMGAGIKEAAHHPGGVPGDRKSTRLNSSH